MNNQFKWEFTDDRGTFMSTSSQSVNQLYFPVCNEAGMMASVSPFGGGDAKRSQNEFLYLPVSIEDLHNNRSTRNFWIYTKGKGAFSVTGNSMRQRADNTFADQKDSSVRVEGGLLYHRLHTEIPELSLKCRFTTFCPANEDAVELNVVAIENNGSEPICFTPTAAFPLFGRSADNMRDHRHATSLMHRVQVKENGIVLKPTIHHNERGHEPNDTSYFVYGAAPAGGNPTDIFPTVEEFIGPGGTYDWPYAVVADQQADTSGAYRKDGMEAIGALKFAEITLAPGKTAEYVICAGITDAADFDAEFEKYNSSLKVQKCLDDNQAYWQQVLDKIKFTGESKRFDGWIRWVLLQPLLRKIYGCSFLPYHDYGRGGRGWRDLWQDYLTLLLQDPSHVRTILVENFRGVRADGSNATIILQDAGQFQADRNKISRVWMDHGAWPYFTVQLYINQTGDIDILNEEVPYWRDQQLNRAKRIDRGWIPGTANVQLTKSGRQYQGTVLEHILLQNLICYFNTGDHGNIKLEDGDWNDQLDLAPEQGETIPFTAFYGMNLGALAEMLKAYQDLTGAEDISVYQEMMTLFQDTGMQSPAQKRQVLVDYYGAVEDGFSDEKVRLSLSMVIDSLAAKGAELLTQVRDREWLLTASGYGFFNGYYNNDGQRVDGDLGNGDARMGLTAQTFAIMSKAASDEQIEKIVQAVNHYLTDPDTKGLRLTMPLGEHTWNFGRGFALIYGEKETGGMFSHMATMYGYALYSRGYVKEGYAVLKTIYNLCTDTGTAQIYPGIPEYVSSRGRGMYAYVTGAGSWTIFTLLTQVYGVRGELGDLIIEPKLTAEQFARREVLSVETEFAKRRLKVEYINANRAEYGDYKIAGLSVNGIAADQCIHSNHARIERKTLLELTDESLVNVIRLVLSNK